METAILYNSPPQGGRHRPLHPKGCARGDKQRQLNADGRLLPVLAPVGRKGDGWKRGERLPVTQPGSGDLDHFRRSIRRAGGGKRDSDVAVLEQL